MLSKAITWLKDWFGSSLLRRDTHRATDKLVVSSVHTIGTRADQRNMKLVAIARQRFRLKEQLEQAKRQKKARKWIYRELEALRTEELKIEAGQ